MKKHLTRIVLLLGLSGVIVMPAAAAWALNYGSGTYGRCQYESCSITLGSSGSVSVNVTPSVAGACTTQKDTVSVFTDDSSGFTLTVANSSTGTSMLNGANTIPSTTGTQSSPTALSANKWGYRVDGVGGFGAGPTSTQTNVALNGTLFAVVPAGNTTADTLANTSIAANPTVNTSVWYGVCASTTTPSGTYTAQVTYTAVTN